MSQSLLPSFKERDFLMHWLTKPDTSLQEEVRTTRLVNGELLNIEIHVNAAASGLMRVRASAAFPCVSARHSIR